MVLSEIKAKNNTERKRGRKKRERERKSERRSTYSYILTLAVAVVGNREFVAALLASSLFESAQALITLAVRPADRSTASWCLALWTAHAPRPSSTHHALLSLFALHFRATLCQMEEDRAYLSADMRDDAILYSPFSIVLSSIDQRCKYANIAWARRDKIERMILCFNFSATYLIATKRVICAETKSLFFSSLNK